MGFASASEEYLQRHLGADEQAILLLCSEDISQESDNADLFFASNASSLSSHPIPAPARCG